MPAVTPLHKCICGAPATRHILASENGLVAIYACEGCFTATRRHLDRLRPIFTALIMAGVPQRVANDTMSFLLRELDKSHD